jgi:hypothetical protein
MRPGRRPLKRLTLGVSLAAMTLAGASQAGAAVTIGSNLGRQPDVDTSFIGSRTTASNLSLAPDRQAPGGLTSPVNGAVVRWRIRVGGSTEVTNFRIIRPLGGGLFTGAGTSAQVTPPINATTAYDVQLPIQSGDYIGLDCCYPSGAQFFVSDPGGATIRNDWQPSLADGGPGRAPGSFPAPFEIALNAVVEPDCDNDSLGDETQDTDLSSCGPGPGPSPGPAPTLPTGAPATCKGISATIVGTEGNDVRTGSQGQDVIVGLGGNDTLSGLAGNDVICGGPGKDVLKGGKGKDSLIGQKGKDALKGGGGKDLCKGGKGKDTAFKCEVEKSI